VANAVDGVKEIVVNGETGFLIEPNNYAKTAEKIMYLLNDETTLKNMSTKACASIGQEYDINHNLKQHEKLYLKLS
jgi:glycosyltransferase involved in cell wall biosynthesis